MGNSFGTIVRAGENANQLSAEHTATRTIFAFEAAGVNFNVTFLTPVTPDDYLRQSIPLSYMHVELDDATSAGRDVQLYTDIDERWVTGHDYDYQNYPYQFTFNEHNGTQQYFIQRTSPQIYTEYRQRAEWGNVSYAALSRPGLSSRNNNNVVAQKEFLDTGGLTLDHNPTAGPMNSYAFAVDFSAKNGSSDALFVIGHLRSP